MACARSSRSDGRRSGPAASPRSRTSSRSATPERGAGSSDAPPWRAPRAEPAHFSGSLADLRAARTAVRLPVLRKDFVVHPSQLIESRAAGADAVLLIAAAVTPLELDALLATARDLGLGVLLEAHSDADLDVALATDAE